MDGARLARGRVVKSMGRGMLYGANIPPFAGLAGRTTRPRASAPLLHRAEIDQA